MPTKKDISDAMKDKRLIVGFDSTMRALRSGGVEKVIIADNCSESMKSEVERYSKISGLEVKKFSGNNKELGTFCKKPFPISVLAVKKV